MTMDHLGELEDGELSDVEEQSEADGKLPEVEKCEKVKDEPVAVNIEEFIAKKKRELVERQKTQARLAGIEEQNVEERPPRLPTPPVIEEPQKEERVVKIEMEVSEKPSKKGFKRYYDVDRVGDQNEVMLANWASSKKSINVVKTESKTPVTGMMPPDDEDFDPNDDYYGLNEKAETYGMVNRTGDMDYRAPDSDYRAPDQDYRVGTEMQFGEERTQYMSDEHPFSDEDPSTQHQGNNLTDVDERPRKESSNREKRRSSKRSSRWDQELQHDSKHKESSRSHRRRNHSGESDNHSNAGGDDEREGEGRRSTSSRTSRKRKRSDSPPSQSSSYDDNKYRKDTPSQFQNFRPFIPWADRERDQNGIPVCKFFKEGYCREGTHCTFSHDSAFAPAHGGGNKMAPHPQQANGKRPDLCKFHIPGGCRNMARCPYMHGEWPCKFYHLKKECRKGNDCPFSHEPLTPVTQQIIERIAQAFDASPVQDAMGRPNFARKVLLQPPNGPMQQGPGGMMNGPGPSGPMGPHGPGPMQQQGPHGFGPNGPRPNGPMPGYNGPPNNMGPGPGPAPWEFHGPNGMGPNPNMGPNGSGPFNYNGPPISQNGPMPNGPNMGPPMQGMNMGPGPGGPPNFDGPPGGPMVGYHNGPMAGPGQFNQSGPGPNGPGPSFGPHMGGPPQNGPNAFDYDARRHYDYNHGPPLGPYSGNGPPQSGFDSRFLGPDQHSGQFPGPSHGDNQQQQQMDQSGQMLPNQSSPTKESTHGDQDFRIKTIPKVQFRVKAMLGAAKKEKEKQKDKRSKKPVKKPKSRWDTSDEEDEEKAEGDDYLDEEEQHDDAAEDSNSELPPTQRDLFNRIQAKQRISQEQNQKSPLKESQSDDDHSNVQHVQARKSESTDDPNSKEDTPVQIDISAMLRQIKENVHVLDSTPTPVPPPALIPHQSPPRKPLIAQEPPEEVETPASPPHEEVPSDDFNGMNPVCVPRMVWRLFPVDVAPYDEQYFARKFQTLSTAQKSSDPRVEKLVSSQFDIVSKMISGKYGGDKRVDQKSGVSGSMSDMMISTSPGNSPQPIMHPDYSQPGVGSSDPRMGARDPRLAKQQSATMSSMDPTLMQQQMHPQMMATSTGGMPMNYPPPMNPMMYSGMNVPAGTLPPPQFQQIQPPFMQQGMRVVPPTMVPPPLSGPMMGATTMTSSQPQPVYQPQGANIQQRPVMSMPPPQGGGWMPSMNPGMSYSGMSNFPPQYPTSSNQANISPSRLPASSPQHFGSPDGGPFSMNKHDAYSRPPIPPMDTVSTNDPLLSDISLPYGSPGSVSQSMASSQPSISLRQKRSDLMYESPLAKNLSPKREATVPETDRLAYNRLPNVRIKKKISQD